MPRAQADALITVPGAGPLYCPEILCGLPYLGQVYFEGGLPGPSSASVLQGYSIFNNAIGENWFPGNDPEVVNYPASIGLLSGSLSAPDANTAAAMGQAMLNLRHHERGWQRQW